MKNTTRYVHIYSRYYHRPDAFQCSNRGSDKRSQQQNDPHCFQSLSLDKVVEVQWGDRIHGVLLILIYIGMIS